MRVKPRFRAYWALLGVLPFLLGSDGRSVVVCLGDSLTEGYGVEDEHAYPSVLERRLRERGRDVRVINAGITGMTQIAVHSNRLNV